MTFLYIHTHSAERCMADKPQETGKMVAKMQEEIKKAGIKSLGAYMVPHEHTLYEIFEADNIAAVEKALIPMTLWGNARLIPVVPMEQIEKVIG